MRPTHVMVGYPIDCKTCGGTGIVKHAFKIGPKGPVCPGCDGAKLRHEAMPIEDFARMFTYGETHGYNRHGPTVENEVRVRDSEQGGGEP